MIAVFFSLTITLQSTCKVLARFVTYKYRRSHTHTHVAKLRRFQCEKKQQKKTSEARNNVQNYESFGKRCCVLRLLHYSLSASCLFDVFLCLLHRFGSYIFFIHSPRCCHIWWALFCSLFVAFFRCCCSIIWLLSFDSHCFTYHRSDLIYTFNLKIHIECYLSM